MVFHWKSQPCGWCVSRLRWGSPPSSGSSALSVLRVLSLSGLLLTALQTRAFPASPVSQVKQPLGRMEFQICLHLFLQSCILIFCLIYLVVVQSLSCVQLFVIPWTAASQAFLSFPSYLSLVKLMFIESVMPSNYLILCCPLLLLPSIFPSIRVFSNESALHIR